MKFLIFGADAFRARRKLAAVRERFIATRDVSGLNVMSFHPDRVDEAVEALRAAPFLADRKLVILDGFLQGPAAAQQSVADALSKQPESTVAVFYEDGSADDLAKSPLFADLKAQKFTEEFPPLGGASAERFAVGEAAAAGAALEPDAARLLVELTGGDSWAIHLEAAKLAAYAGGLATAQPTVTVAMVQDLVNDGRETPAFALIDAAAAGRTADAARYLERMLEGGAGEPYILALLAKHYRAALAARDLLDRGQSDAGLLARAVGLHPFVASKAFAFARRHSAAVLAARYEELVRMERAYKSGGPDARATLTLFAAAVVA